MDNEKKETFEEMYERIVKPMIPMNECVYEGSRNYYDSTTQRSEILKEETQIQNDLIRDLKERVEDLTRIVNVLATRPILIDRRKLKTESCS